MGQRIHLPSLIVGVSLGAAAMLLVVGMPRASPPAESPTHIVPRMDDATAIPAAGPVPVGDAVVLQARVAELESGWQEMERAVAAARDEAERYQQGLERAVTTLNARDELWRQCTADAGE